MSKKTKKTTIMIDGTEYKVIEWTNKTETNIKYVPQNSPGEIGSGLHLPENRQRAHWDGYNGNKKIDGQEKYIEEPLKLPPMVLINFEQHQVISLPPNNEIAVLRGSYKPMEFISLRYYREHKDEYLRKYKVILGNEENPQVLELKY